MTAKPVVINGPTAVSGKTTTSTTPTPSNVSKFVPSSTWTTIGTIVHVVAAFAAIAWVPFGKSSSYLAPLFDLLFTDTLKDYAALPVGLSMVGPALLATVTRPLTVVFDERVRTFLIAKLPLLKVSESVIAMTRLYILETRAWTFLAARFILAVAFVLSLAALRRALSLKFKSIALPRIFSALCLASVIPLLYASSLQAQTFSVILLNFALAALFSGNYARTFSLLTVNAVIFDILSGSVLLLATLMSAVLFLEDFKAVRAVLSILLTAPIALVVSLVFDSLFYNKFIWPQGELLLAFSPPSFNNFNLASLSFEALRQSKLASNLLFALAPALLIHIFGRSNRFIRVLLAIYTLTSTVSLSLFSASLAAACSPLLVPLLVSASLATLGGIKSSNRVCKYFTHFFFVFGVLPAIFWTAGRIHLSMAHSSQYTGSAVMALNARIIKNAQEGVPTRVLVDTASTSFGYNRFLNLVDKFAIYSTTPASASFRPDYIVAPQKTCPESKAIKYYSGFDRINLKNYQLYVSEVEQVGVFRYTPSKCPSDSAYEKNNSPAPPKNAPSKASIFVSEKFLNGKFASLKEQADFIAQHLGKFNHKKISNSIAFIAYLYANALDQI